MNKQARRSGRPGRPAAPSGGERGPRREARSTRGRPFGGAEFVRRPRVPARLTWIRLAGEVIEGSGRNAPADRVMREVLKRHRQVGTLLSAEVARGVSAYYRWWGWVEASEGAERRLREALELDERFRSVPQGFGDTELRNRVVPSWVWRETATDLAWCRFLQRHPVLWLRAEQGQAGGLAQELGHCKAGPPSMPEALRYDGQSDVYGTAAFLGGRVEIQDLSSQAVGLLCGVRPGEHWWDVCAGEGGKTLHLAVLMRGRGVVWATDRAAWRLARLKRRAARADVFNYQAALWEGGEAPPFKVQVDGALVDAPCTGLGTWQRNPQARWTVQPGDVEELAQQQIRLLRSAAGAVKRGGRLVYSVCTLTQKETTGVAEAFEQSAPEFEPLVMNHPWHPGQSAARLSLQPWSEGGNGMFVAAWRRRRPASPHLASL